MLRTLVCLLTCALLPAEAAFGQPLRLDREGTEQVYFTYRGEPLLSFGGLSDFIFYTADAYDYRLWADWAAEHGMNHIRAYPPLSWKHIEHFASRNGGSIETLQFPYAETEPGSRQFDLTRFDEAYWQRFREQCEYLQEKGIILHLLMWNGWQLRAADTPGDDRSEIDWDGHFFNPANNVNAFTDHLGDSLAARVELYHSVADRRSELAEAQRAWFRKLIETTADLDNVYYDLVHELAEHQGDWTKTQAWIENMTTAVRLVWEALDPDRPLLIGMDAGGLEVDRRDWIFSQPYFNLLIYGKRHTVEQAVNWRTLYRKPYIPQESWDDDGTKYSLIHPEQRTHIRKYLWKMMLAKVQQMDIYVKPRPGFTRARLPPYPHNYDPRGRNPFEDDALTLRAFWNALVDYPNLGFQGEVAGGPGAHRLLLASEREAVVYLSSATGEERTLVRPGSVRLADLPLADGRYRLDVWDPKAGPGIIDSRDITVSGGITVFDVPAFVDDLAVHLRPVPE